jgi:ABC-type Fe3+ transport system permease subunit
VLDCHPLAAATWADGGQADILAFTTWLDLLDHWQSLVAGVLAFLAAVIVGGGAEWFARRKERCEVAAIRASVAIEKSSSSIFNYPSVVLA